MTNDQRNDDQIINTTSPEHTTKTSRSHYYQSHEHSHTKTTSSLKNSLTMTPTQLLQPYPFNTEVVVAELQEPTTTSTQPHSLANDGFMEVEETKHYQLTSSTTQLLQPQQTARNMEEVVSVHAARTTTSKTEAPQYYYNF